MKLFRKVLVSSLIAIILVGCSISDKKNVRLYPFFTFENNHRVWGFMDAEGKPAIRPTFSRVMNFDENGFALVSRGEAQGAIDILGRDVVKTKYEEVAPFTNGFFVARDNNEFEIIDENGEVTFTTKEYLEIGNHNDKMHSAAKFNEEKKLYRGYINEKGEIKIPFEYDSAYDFYNGKAVVKKENKYFVISAKGNVTKELDYDIIENLNMSDYLKTTKDGITGIIRKDGEKTIENIGGKLQGVFNDYFVVTEDNADTKEFVIDINGKEILKEKYDRVRMINDNFIAVGNRKDDKIIFALADLKGKLVTEFNYLEIFGLKSNVNGGIFGVDDGEKTFLMDSKGKTWKPNTNFETGAFIYTDKKLITKVSNGKLYYYKLNGDLIWEEKNIFKVNNDIEVVENEYITDNSIIYYPVINGMKNEEVQNNINKMLYDYTVENETLDSEKLNVKYSVEKRGELIIFIVEKLRPERVVAASEKRIFNINLGNGEEYKLDNLFIKDANSMEDLNEIAMPRMLQGVLDEKEIDLIDENTQFKVGPETIELYPSKPTSTDFNGNFPSATIRLEELKDILDFKTSDFWWAFYGVKSEF